MNSRQKIYQITSVFLIFDQFFKLLVNNCLNLHQEIKIIPHFFSIYYVKNTGAAFSILKDSTTLLIIVSVIFIIILDKLIKKEENINKLGILSLGCILGGIFGNLIDRILHHGVIDYLSFTIFNYDFPIFNLADIGITVGIVVLMISMLIEKDSSSPKYRKKSKKD